MKLWNRLLIFLHIRRDWANETERTPPAFDSIPHAYDPQLNGRTLSYCAECGGGWRHPIHQVKPMTPASDPHRPPIVDTWGNIRVRSLEEISKDSLEAGDIVRHHFNHEND